MASYIEIVLGLVVSLYVLVGVIVFKISKDIKNNVEDALTKADEEGQAELRKKLVKALFPPRFNRD